MAILRIYEKIYAAKINTPTVHPHHALRRFIRKIFTSFIKHQTAELQHGFRKEVIQKLQDIEDMIAREMAREAKHSK